MAQFDWIVQQGSADWFKLRSGIPTASEFDKIITPAKGLIAEARWKYACRLVAERLMNWQAESLDKIEHIEEGRANEPLAVAQFELVNEVETRRVGFVRTDDGRFGASPDRVIGAEASQVDVVLEIKAPTIPVQFEYLLLGQGSAYRCQVAGQLWVAEADKAIWYSYHPRMPPCMVETGRDEPFIAKLRDALEQFSDELEALTAKARTLGLYQPFESILPPAEIVAAAQMSGGASAIPDWLGLPPASGEGDGA
jgi:hypothetical protein